MQSEALHVIVPNHLEFLFWNESFDLEKEVTLLLRAFDSASPIKLCLKALDITRSLGKLHNEVYELDDRNQLSPLNPEQRASLWSAVLKSFNLPSFCAEITELRDLALKAVPNEVNSNCDPGADRFSNCHGSH